MVQHVERNLNGPELHFAAVVRPSFSDVVRLHSDGDQKRGAEEHAGQDALTTLLPEAFRQLDLLGGLVEFRGRGGHVSSSESTLSTMAYRVGIFA